MGQIVAYGVVHGSGGQVRVRLENPYSSRGPVARRDESPPTIQDVDSIIQGHGRYLNPGHRISDLRKTHVEGWIILSTDNQNTIMRSLLLQPSMVQRHEILAIRRQEGQPMLSGIPEVLLIDGSLSSDGSWRDYLMPGSPQQGDEGIRIKIIIEVNSHEWSA